MVGFGYDVHRLAEGESLILGGVSIDSSIGTVAHSDGDVLIHAIIDAILGAAGMGDIGDHFPDTDEKYKNIDSTLLLNKTLSILNTYNLYIVNIDAEIVLEKPKLAAYKLIIRNNLAKICGLPERRVNIKATTNEKMGFLGRGEGVAVYAVCQVEEK
jgi:2-C-methyl-D-erythritol 2,4-cyclodiphosphate synthase